MIRIGSLFSGIGGFELGVERAIPNSKTVWQVEQNLFCQTVLRKHWPNAKIYDDVCLVEADKVEPVEILLGGFPCQDISIAGNQQGVYNGEKSSLWWHMHRIIGDIRPRVVIMENVANIVRLGGTDVVGSLAKIGYDCEWTVVRSGSDFGAPHHRARWFCVAYPVGSFAERGAEKHRAVGQETKPQLGFTRRKGMSTLWNNKRASDWTGIGTKSSLCRMDDGLPRGLDSAQHNRIRKERLKALGNAVVPQCSEWIGLQVLNSGLIDDLF